MTTKPIMNKNILEKSRNFDRRYPAKDVGWKFLEFSRFLILAYIKFSLGIGVHSLIQQSKQFMFECEVYFYSLQKYL